MSFLAYVFFMSRGNLIERERELLLCDWNLSSVFGFFEGLRSKPTHIPLPPTTSQLPAAWLSGKMLTS